MRARKHLSLETKLAAALYEFDRMSQYLYPAQPGSAADRMHQAIISCRKVRAPAKKLLGLFRFDHVEYHAQGGSDEWWNLTPMPEWEHLEKTKRDLGVIAKGKRIARKHQQHEAVMAAKGEYIVVRNNGPKRGWQVLHKGKEIAFCATRDEARRTVATLMQRETPNESRHPAQRLGQA